MVVIFVHNIEVYFELFPRDGRGKQYGVHSHQAETRRALIKLRKNVITLDSLLSAFTGQP